MICILGYQVIEKGASLNKNQIGCQNENFSFASLYLQILLEYDASVSKRVLKLKLWIYTYMQQVTRHHSEYKSRF